MTAQTEREFVFLFFTVHVYVMQSDIKAQRITFLQRDMAPKTNMLVKPQHVQYEPDMYDELLQVVCESVHAMLSTVSHTLNKPSSLPTWPWCVVPPDHTAMFTLPASLVLVLQLLWFFDLPNTSLAIHSFSTVLLLDNYKSEIKYYSVGLVSFIALEFSM